jgi:hypothetical protein
LNEFYNLPVGNIEVETRLITRFENNGKHIMSLPVDDFMQHKADGLSLISSLRGSHDKEG